MPIKMKTEVPILNDKAQFKSLPPAARLAVAVFGMVGLLLLIVSTRWAGQLDAAHFGLMLFLAVVTAHAKVRLIGGSSLSLLTTVVLMSVMMLGAEAAVLVSVCGVYVQTAFPRRRCIPHHIVFNIGMIALTVLVAGKAYHWMVRGFHPFTFDELVGSLVASLIYYLGNSLCVSLIVALSTRRSMFRLWHDNFLYTAPLFFLAGLLAFLVSKLIWSFPGITLMVALPILYLSYYSYRVYLRSLESEKTHSAEMAELFNSTLSTLALAIDARDRNTHGHIQRVQRYSRAIAEGMHLDEREIKAIAAAALLHDIGKLAIPEYILNKTGPLTPEEMKKMRLHPRLGAEIISNIKFPYPVADSIMAHHERFDGSGYPNGLAGKDIPLGARVLAVADVFDTYTSDRVGSEETIDGAIEVLTQGAGTLFDPDIVSVWESIHRDVVSWNPATTRAYTHIQRATSEIKILESLADSIAGVTDVKEIIAGVGTLLKSSFPGCKAAVHVGEHDEGIPVIFSGSVVATISVYRPDEPLTEDETRLLTVIAEKISGTLNNAIALEAAKRQATVDQLTGLANRHAFERISKSLAGQHCSIVLVDVNAFKGVNDNFGHQAGDATLARIGAHLRAAFDHARLLCRLGGDEFLVVSMADQRTLRMQIRNFRKMIIWDPAHEPYKKLLFGVSCGLANIPADGKTIEQAMQRADERMYAVKTRFKQWASRVTAA